MENGKTRPRRGCVKGLWGRLVRQIGKEVVRFHEIQPVLHDRALINVAHFDAAIAITDHNRVTDIDEKAIFHHTRHLVQHQRQLAGIADALHMQIKDMVALIGDERTIPIHPQRGLTAQNIHGNQRFLNQRLRGLPAKGDHFDGQREGTQMLNLFADIGDDDHLITGGRHDLFLQEGTATPLDQVQVAVKFVGPVNGQIQPLGLVQRNHLDAHLTGQIGGPGGRRHTLDAQTAIADLFAQTTHQPRRR
mmetsp:Transcript_23944/g.43636  ORF Transcript_23944/g.43636 Transcript_23944/m.43636 type:complete len:248 (+) Transcript_23944:1695-2438(+)